MPWDEGKCTEIFWVVNGGNGKLTLPRVHTMFSGFMKTQESVVGFGLSDANPWPALLNAETSEPSFFPLLISTVLFRFHQPVVLMLFEQESCPPVEHLSPTPKLNRFLNICKIPHVFILWILTIFYSCQRVSFSPKILVLHPHWYPNE